jgi:hypothetical protein
MDLIKAARKGEEIAFLQLFDEHHLPLFRFAYRLTGSSHKDLRATLWMAPDLACFGLKSTLERKWPDGTFHLESERRTLRINRIP